MFESIVIRNTGHKGEPIDSGFIAEAMLFYQSVHLLLNPSSLSHLLIKIGPDCLLRLLEDHNAKITYIHDQTGIISNTKKGILTYDIGCVTSAIDQKSGKLLGNKSKLQYLFNKVLGKSKATNIYVRKFTEHIHFNSVHTNYGTDHDLLPEIRDDLSNSNFTERAAKYAIQRYLPDYESRSGWKFDKVPYGPEFLIDTSLDFDHINSLVKQQHPKTDVVITPAQIISDITEGCIDLRLSAFYSTEYATTPSSSLIAQARIDKAIKACVNNYQDIELFQNILFNKAVSVREAINSGDRSFEDFLDLLNKSPKFNDWLGGITPNTSLLAQYQNDITSGNWLDQLAPKGIRFSLATGLGILIDVIAPTGLGTMAGLTLSAADTFLIDKLIKGWNPSHFVSGELQDFITKSKNTP